MTGHLPLCWLPSADHPQMVEVAAELVRCRKAPLPEEKPSIWAIAADLGLAMPEVMIGIPVVLLAGLLTASSALSARLSAAFAALQF